MSKLMTTPEDTSSSGYSAFTTVLLASAVPLVLSLLAHFTMQVLPATATDYLLLIPPTLGGATAALVTLRFNSPSRFRRLLQGVAVGSVVSFVAGIICFAAGGGTIVADSPLQDFILKNLALEAVPVGFIGAGFGIARS